MISGIDEHWVGQFGDTELFPELLADWLDM
jgi:hypothetical protein